MNKLAGWPLVQMNNAVLYNYRDKVKLLICLDIGQGKKKKKVLNKKKQDCSNAKVTVSSLKNISNSVIA